MKVGGRLPILIENIWQILGLLTGLRCDEKSVLEF